MTSKKTLRLKQAAVEFNIGMQTLVDFLKQKGISISTDPNLKLSEDMYDLVYAEFQSEKEVKTDAHKAGLNFTQKESISLEAKPVEEVKAKEEEEEKTLIIKSPTQLSTPVVKPVVPEEEPVKEEPVSQIKILGKVDLSTMNTKTKPDRKTKEEKDKERIERKEGNKPPTKEEKPIERPEPVVETPAIEATLTQPTVPAEAPIIEAPEEEKVVHVIRAESERLSGVTILGKMELPKPPSPTKREPVASSNDYAANKKKRKRIKTSTEPTATNPSTEKPKPSNPNFKDNKGVKPTPKPEVSEEDIQKKIRETLEKLGTKHKSKSSKYRRDKRDSAQQQMMSDLEQQERNKSILQVTEFVTANELATMMDISVSQVISTCMSLGLFVSINQRLDAETISIVADEFGFKIEFVSVDVQEAIKEEDDKPEDIIERAPIVTVMGHVDHGKTSLLDFIRKTNVIAGEAGGITQHIGAYEVTLENGKKVAFLDTPGHEAFTAMRARGAKVTDIAVIIVAADDDIMPQTREAINHAQAAEVPMIIAINKIDKVGANPEKIKEQLANLNILVEDWGGKYQCQEISAKMGINVDKLLEKILLEAELLELKGNPKKKAIGTVIESSLDKGRGYVAKIMVQNGTLKTGDVVLAGCCYGKVKAMYNERNIGIKTAGPSTPLLLLGLNGAPQAGDQINVIDNEQEAKAIASRR